MNGPSNARSRKYESLLRNVSRNEAILASMVSLTFFEREKPAKEDPSNRNTLRSSETMTTDESSMLRFVFRLLLLLLLLLLSVFFAG